MVQIFGRFHIDRPTTADPPKLTLPTQALIANLILRNSNPARRAELCHQIWPGIEPARAANRLRTALVHARKALGAEAFKSDNYQISLEVGSDLSQAVSLRRRIRIADNPQHEMALLQQLLQVIGQDLLPELPGAWIEPHREEWRSHRIQAAQRLADIAAESQQYELAFAEAARILATDEFDEGGWGSYLNASVQLSREREAMARFTEARRRLRQDLGDDFSPELRDIMRRLNAGQVDRPGVRTSPTQGVKEMMSQIVEDQLTESPELLLPLFRGEAFRQQAYQRPLEAFHLLRTTLEVTHGIEPPRVFAQLMAIKLADMVDEVTYALDAADWLIDSLPEDRPEHAYALSLRGHISFELREFAEAEDFIGRYYELSNRFGSQSDIAVAQIVRALVPLHLGRFDEAEGIYRLGLENLPPDGPIKDLHNRGAVLNLLATLNCFKGDWPAVRDWAEQSRILGSAHRFHFLLCQADVLLGAALVREGRVPDGFRLLASGFSQSFRSRYRTMNLSAADTVASALVHAGYSPAGLGLLDCMERIRSQNSYDRTPAEQAFVDAVRVCALPAEPDPVIARLENRSDIVAKVCDRLELS